MRRKSWRAFTIAVGAQILSYGLLSLIVVGGLIHGLCWAYEPVTFQQAIGIKNELGSTISLGLIYASFQSLFLIVGLLIISYNYLAYLIMVWMSNALGIMFTYMLIKLIMFSYYV